MFDLIARITRLSPPAFFMGGLAEDVLLGQGLEHPHHDLDLLAPPGEADGLLARLGAAGIGDWRVALADEAGRPVLWQGRAGDQVFEVYATGRQPGGGFRFEVPAQGPAGRLRLYAPPDTFDYPPSPVAGLALHTVSPWALALMRAASAQTRHAGDAEKRARDLARLAELRRAFLAGPDEAQLQPEFDVLDT